MTQGSTELAEVSIKESANNYKRDINQREEGPANFGITLHLHMVFTFRIRVELHSPHQDFCLE